MKTYEYRGYDSGGHAHRGLVEALSLKSARGRLAGEGILAESLSVAARKVRFPQALRSLFYRELSTLLGAGLPLVKALEVMLESQDMKDSHLLLAGVRDRVREGSSLAEALSEASSSMSSFERAIIEAAEKSANVELMLDRLASFLEEQDRLKETIHGALIYPSIVITAGICVAMLMLGLLMPMARKIMDAGNVSMPQLTLFVIALGRFMLKWGIGLLALLFAAFWYVRHKVKHDGQFRKKWHMALFRLPVFGKGLTIIANLRFAKTLSILLHGGVSLVEGMPLAGRATGNEWIEKLAEQECDAVKHGSSLSDAVGRIPPLSSSLSGLVKVGEASGELGRMLENAGTRLQGQWDRFIKRCLSLLEPVLIFLIGGFVLMITLSVLLPVLSLSQVVGK